MRRFAGILLLTLILGACSKSASVTTSTGQRIDLNALHGKWLIVNYWATWCHNCQSDMHYFELFYKQHHDTVIVLGVNFDGLENTKLNAIQKKWHISFPLSSGFPIEQFGITHIDSLPRTYVFSPDGKLQKTLYGPQTDKTLSQAVGINAKAST